MLREDFPFWRCAHLRFPDLIQVTDGLIYISGHTLDLIFSWSNGNRIWSWGKISITLNLHGQITFWPWSILWLLPALGRNGMGKCIHSCSLYPLRSILHSSVLALTVRCWGHSIMLILLFPLRSVPVSVMGDGKGGGVCLTNLLDWECLKNSTLYLCPFNIYMKLLDEVTLWHRVSCHQ